MSIQIHWSGLVQVAEVSAVFAIGGALIFTAGVLGLSRAEAARDGGSDRPDGRGGSGGRGAAIAVAVAAFAACAALVLYGLYLMIPQFQ